MSEEEDANATGDKKKTRRVKVVKKVVRKKKAADGGGDEGGEAGTWLGVREVGQSRVWRGARGA